MDGSFLISQPPSSSFIISQPPSSTLTVLKFVEDDFGKDILVKNSSLSQELDFTPHVLSSCRGFVLLSDQDKFLIYQPSTKKFFEVASAPFKPTPSSVLSVSRPTTPRFVIFSLIRDPDQERYTLFCFSSKEGTWQLIQKLGPNIEVNPTSGVSVNGKGYWLVKEESQLENGKSVLMLKVLVIELRQGRLREDRLEMPKIRKDEDPVYQLGRIRDHLALVMATQQRLMVYTPSASKWDEYKFFPVREQLAGHWTKTNDGEIVIRPGDNPVPVPLRFEGEHMNLLFKIGPTTLTQWEEEVKFPEFLDCKVWDHSSSPAGYDMVRDLYPLAWSS